MIFKILMSCLGCLVFISPVFSEEEYQWNSKPYAQKRPGPRTGFGCTHDYDPFDTMHQVNDLIVIGGQGPNATPMDTNGSFWIQKLHRDSAHWDQISPLSTCSLPPPRRDLACVVYPLLHNELGSSSNMVKRFRNLVTFGGMTASGPVNSMWVCAQIYTNYDILGMEQFWTWIEADQSGAKIDARSGHRMLFIPPSPGNDKSCVFLMGGLDENGDPLMDAYLGELSCSITPGSASNPWDMTVSITCDWRDLDLASSGLDDIGLTGQSVVYDPFYGSGGQPRILIYGGYDQDGEVTDAIGELNLGDLEWSAITPFGAGPEARADHACAMDVREHRMIIHGGRNADEDVLNDVACFDLTNYAWVIDLVGGRPYRYGHGGAYYWFTLFGGISETGEYMDDTWEYKPLISGKT